MMALSQLLEGELMVCICYTQRVRVRPALYEIMKAVDQGLDYKALRCSEQSEYVILPKQLQFMDTSVPFKQNQRKVKKKGNEWEVNE